MSSNMLTMKDVAKFAGVSHPVVSAVMNNNYKHVKVSKVTRERVRRIIKEYGYFPNASGRYLSTSKTGHLGFMLADSVAGGFGNVYFAEVLKGIDIACRRKGWGLNVSLYNLSNIDSFIMPERVGQRTVDGLILAGYTSSVVIKRFSEMGIPCICIDDDSEVADIVPTVTTDLPEGLAEAINYARSIGHRKIGYCLEYGRRGLQIKQSLSHFDDIYFFYASGGHSDYRAAKPLFESWISMAKGERPSLIIATDQTLVSFLKILSENGMSCPENVSLISSCDTSLCEYSTPSITAVSHNQYDLGVLCVELLVEHLENGKKLVSEKKYNCSLHLRESCNSTN